MVGNEVPPWEVGGWGAQKNPPPPPPGGGGARRPPPPPPPPLRGLYPDFLHQLQAGPFTEHRGDGLVLIAVAKGQAAQQGLAAVFGELGQPEAANLVGPVVLGHEQPVALLELPQAEPARAGGGLALQVGHLAPGAVPHLPAGLPGPPAPVGLLEVHEEPFVQGTDLLQGLAADHEAGAGDVVNLGGRIVAARNVDDAPGKGAAQPDAPGIQKAQPVVARPGKEAPGQGRSAVPVHQQRSGHRGAGPVLQEAVQRLEAAGRADRVRVQEQHRVAAGPGQGQVVAPAEAQVAAALNQFTAGKLFPDQVG